MRVLIAIDVPEPRCAKLRQKEWLSLNYTRSEKLFGLLSSHSYAAPPPQRASTQLLIDVQQYCTAGSSVLPLCSYNQRHMLNMPCFGPSSALILFFLPCMYPLPSTPAPIPAPIPMLLPNLISVPIITTILVLVPSSNHRFISSSTPPSSSVQIVSQQLTIGLAEMKLSPSRYW
ncbi:hypothetical protein BCR41DRAFT_387033 [Lobosporangium transversale]|uniref:Uncharacterized protein n=1 Tax=Lobosporangium transversale TaxID=64571 RepID=A0A1Y2GMR1_9FUNG|nr:hypothetical protein BCR41DRAFT_387033 [Lobosporangium transversale]ORZ13790.1 hypothetical protein BCR41DRAFT_387033 [Lobosporangium transversale]|eukprot:XP_021880574.1 hypothetical protein BCR41DRAFT_387033 [Lobosporangium transversale]